MNLAIINILCLKADIEGSSREFHGESASRTPGIEQSVKLADAGQEESMIRAALTLGLLAGLASAAPVDGDRAASLAIEWMAAKTATATPVLATVTARPAGAPALWIARFEPAGFVIVSADDAARPVVGWSADSPAPEGIDHPALEGWLDGAAAQVVDARALGLSDPAVAAEWDRILSGSLEASRDVLVEPLLSTRWDQGAGWNQFCPQDAAGPAGRVWAGCVAVSMVQVMKYWNQPATGVGSHGYNSGYGWLSVDFSAAEYDFDAMTDVGATEEAAELMYHAAVAVDMGFGPDGSGAWVGFGNPCAHSALLDHFAFGPGSDFIERGDMSAAQWRQRMADEVSASRPVIYRGYGTGGHAFNLDGWRDDDYFHFNWGWSGAYNGWFQLNALNPGGNDFTEGMGAIVGLVPEVWQQAPLLTTPTAGASGVPCEPAVFQWLAAEDATSYDFQVDDDAGFTTPIADFAGLEALEATVTDLEHWRDYWWRVRSHGLQGTGPWSPVQRLTTDYWNQTPAPPQVNPGDGAQGLNPDRVVFVWDFVDGAEEYALQLALDDGFSELVADTVGIDTNHAILGGLQPGTQHWWRVRCDGPAGWSDWTEARTLVTESATGLEAPAGPEGWSLAPPWPNPFNPSTEIAFVQPTAASVTLSVHDLAGRRVATLHEGALPAGEHRFVWNAEASASGLYFVRLEGPGVARVARVALIR